MNKGELGRIAAGAFLVITSAGCTDEKVKPTSPPIATETRATFTPPVEPLQSTITPIYSLPTSIVPPPEHSPTPTMTPTEVPEEELNQELAPSDVIDLTPWKLTLPTGSVENPIEIEQPELTGYNINPWFGVTADGAVRFRAPVTGVTTEGSDYPRTELREMTADGERAAWSPTSGVHTMFIEQAITAVPRTKQHIVVGQIHGEDNDVIAIRLEMDPGEESELFIDINGKTGPVLDPDYVLGRRFTVEFVVENGKTTVYYNPVPHNDSTRYQAFDRKLEYSGAYFKAGAYPQSNCEKELTSDCTDDNYGEVEIYKLGIVHTDN